MPLARSKPIQVTAERLPGPERGSIVHVTPPLNKPKVRTTSCNHPRRISTVALLQALKWKATDIQSKVSPLALGVQEAHPR